MAAVRPLARVFAHEDPKEVVKSVPLPKIFSTPIRVDVVHAVHTAMAKNKRQAYAVSEGAGHQTSAESWGTGRAVSRIPRVAGGGTHRAGQGAFGNMCRGGRMFNPTKIWRKWHQKISVKQRRYAVACAVAASAVPALVMARGHRIEEIPEVPLVLSAGVEAIERTKDAEATLVRFGAAAELKKVRVSRTLRAGKGKLRNRRHVQRRGPLIVYEDRSSHIVRAFRNIPGVELCQVEALSLLQLAPGGHVGRFIVWTQQAFEALDKIWEAKKGFSMPRPLLTTPDLGRLLNADEVAAVVRPTRKVTKLPRKKNPLKNLGVMLKLNPHAARVRRTALKQQQARAAGVAEKRRTDRKAKAASRAAGLRYFDNLVSEEYMK
jgi:large subunit ribosomal protein L4e